MGFLAQDVEAVLGDDYNVLGIGGDKERTLSLRYTDLIAPMVKAIQEQDATIKAQQARIDAKDARIADLGKQQAAQQVQIDSQKAQIEELRRIVQKVIHERAVEKTTRVNGT